MSFEFTYQPSIRYFFTEGFLKLQVNNINNITTFKPASESEISKILFNCPNKQSDFDLILTWLLKECSALQVTITNIHCSSSVT